MWGVVFSFIRMKLIQLELNRILEYQYISVVITQSCVISNSILLSIFYYFFTDLFTLLFGFFHKCSCNWKVSWRVSVIIQNKCVTVSIYCGYFK